MSSKVPFFALWASGYASGCDPTGRFQWSSVLNVAGSDHSNKLFSIKEHPKSNGFQVLWGCFQARNIGHNHL